MMARDEEQAARTGRRQPGKKGKLLLLFFYLFSKTYFK
jgi:hypothetical protein